MIRLVLCQPQIPQNVGALLRLSACWNVPLDCVGPFPFLWSDRHLKRAGLDYIPHAPYTRFASFEEYAAQKSVGQRYVALTTQASVSFLDFRFGKGDCLIVGSEGSGLPEHVVSQADARVVIPMVKGRRSLNMSMAGAIVVAEALRQTQGFSVMQD